MTDMNRQTMPSVMRAEYRARRMQNSGHPCYTPEQLVLFDFQGIS
jgi:hypothetical protein